MIIRQAIPGDIPQLAENRWLFRSQLEQPAEQITHEVFIEAMTGFLQRIMPSEYWAIWVAAESEKVIANVYLEVISKLPSVHNLHPSYGYVTNMFTLPEFRCQGIGARLLDEVKAWAADQKLDYLILWPSKASINFYQLHGFTYFNDAMEIKL